MQSRCAKSHAEKEQEERRCHPSSTPSRPSPSTSLTKGRASVLQVRVFLLLPSFADAISRGLKSGFGSLRDCLLALFYNDSGVFRATRCEPAVRSGASARCRQRHCRRECYALACAVWHCPLLPEITKTAACFPFLFRMLVPDVSEEYSSSFHPPARRHLLKSVNTLSEQGIFSPKLRNTQHTITIDTSLSRRQSWITIVISHCGMIGITPLNLHWAKNSIRLKKGYGWFYRKSISIIRKSG